MFELDLVLRNNITTEEYPDGVYHPHPEHHHIKKENIGLIEVMGLAVLPARLKNEMELLAKAILAGDNVNDILKNEIGLVYSEILEQCGVYKRDEEGKKLLRRFMDSINK